MTNEQLYLSLGVPIVFNALMMLFVMNRIGGLETSFHKRVDDLRDLLRAEIRVVDNKLDERTKHILDKMEELDSQLTRIEGR